MALGLALAALGGGNILGNIFAAREQRRGLERGQRIQKEFLGRLLGLQEDLLGQTRPFRDIALNRARLVQDLLPGLTERLTTPSQNVVSDAFRLAGREGLDLLTANAVTSGSPVSGPAQLAKGRFLEGLGAREAQSLINQQNFDTRSLLGFVGGGPSPVTGIGQSNALLGAAAGPVGALSSAETAKGAVSGGLFGSIGQDIGQLGFLKLGGLDLSGGR